MHLTGLCKMLLNSGYESCMASFKMLSRLLLGVIFVEKIGS